VDDDNKVVLVKMYSDEAALDLHVASPRFKATEDDYQDMLKIVA